jgi:NADH-quinone oxidoreductase subunit L
VIGGAIVGGATGATRGASALVRRLQSGYLRSYSAVLLSGLVVVLVYFLAQS